MAHHSGVSQARGTVREHRWAPPAADDVVELCVGGNMVHVLRSTLCAVPGSRLFAMFCGRCNDLPRTAAGHIFLDYDPFCFSKVIQYLRGIAIDPLTPLPRVPRQYEAEFTILARYLGVLPAAAAAAGQAVTCNASDPADTAGDTAGDATPDPADTQGRTMSPKKAVFLPAWGYHLLAAGGARVFTASGGSTIAVAGPAVTHGSAATATATATAASATSAADDTTADDGIVDTTGATVRWIVHVDQGQEGVYVGIVRRSEVSDMRARLSHTEPKHSCDVRLLDVSLGRLYGPRHLAISGPAKTVEVVLDTTTRILSFGCDGGELVDAFHGIDLSHEWMFACMLIGAGRRATLVSCTVYN